MRTFDNASEEELDWETDEEAVADVQGLVRELDAVSSYAPERTRDAILMLPLVPIFPSYAEGVLRLRANVAALGRRIETDVLAQAVSSSKEGASLARQHALQCRALKRDALLAALEGVVLYPLDDVAFNETTALLDRKGDVIPRLEQLAHLAYRGARRKAERLYGGDDLLFGLMSAADHPGLIA